LNISHLLKSKTSVVASLIAAGYVLGEDIVQKAKEFDASHSGSWSVESIKTKAQQLEEEYRLSGRLKEFGEKVTDAVKRVDENLKFSESVERAISHPSISAGLERLRVIGFSVKSTLDAQIRDVGVAIDERHAQRAKNTPTEPKPTSPPSMELHDMASSSSHVQEAKEPAKSEVTISPPSHDPGLTPSN
jgi:hypothetical protein